MAFFIPVTEGWGIWSGVDAIALWVSMGWRMVGGEMTAYRTCKSSHHMIPITCIAPFLLVAWGGLQCPLVFLNPPSSTLIPMCRPVTVVSITALERSAQAICKLLYLLTFLLVCVGHDIWPGYVWKRHFLSVIIAKLSVFQGQKVKWERFKNVILLLW